MPAVECRVDKLAFGDVPIAAIMGIPPAWAPQVFVRAPSFPVSRAEALRIVATKTAGLSETKIHLSKEILRPGELELRFGDLAPDQAPHRRGSWVAFVDLHPDQSYAHPCKYLLVDPDGSVRMFDADWFPLDFRERFAPVT